MSFIAKLFKPPTPAAVAPPAAPAAPPPTPTYDQAAMQQDQEDRIRQRKGSASTILVPGMLTPSSQTGGASAMLGG